MAEPVGTHDITGLVTCALCDWSDRSASPADALTAHRMDTHPDAYIRECSIPGCPAAYDVLTGPPPHEHTPERRWLRLSTFQLMLCPDHVHLWEGAAPHRPRLDHATRTAACACGLTLPGPTLGDMQQTWIDHARLLVDEEGPTDE